MTYRKYNHRAKQKYKKATYRSGFEDRIAKELDELGVNYEYEKYKISFTQPTQERTYTPDFLLPNGIFIETKGVFDSADRKKHLLIKEQYGDKYDIRFVFWNANQVIYKGSKTTHAMWCKKYGFKYAHKQIPSDWLNEKSRGNL